MNFFLYLLLCMNLFSWHFPSHEFFFGFFPTPHHFSNGLSLNFVVRDLCRSGCQNNYLPPPPPTIPPSLPLFVCFFFHHPAAVSSRDKADGGGGDLRIFKFCKRVSMGLTDRGKMAQNLVDSR